MFLMFSLLNLLETLSGQTSKGIFFQFLSNPSEIHLETISVFCKTYHPGLPLESDPEIRQSLEKALPKSPTLVIRGLLRMLNPNCIDGASAEMLWEDLSQTLVVKYPAPWLEALKAEKKLETLGVELWRLKPIADYCDPKEPACSKEIETKLNTRKLAIEKAKVDPNLKEYLLSILKIFETKGGNLEISRKGRDDCFFRFEGKTLAQVKVCEPDFEPELLHEMDFEKSKFEQVLIFQERTRGNACNGLDFHLFGTNKGRGIEYLGPIEFCGGKDPVIKRVKNRVEFFFPGGRPNRPAKDSSNIPDEKWEYQDGKIRRAP